MAFTALAGVLVTLTIAFGLFAARALSEYGAKTTVLDWQAQRLGDQWYVSAVASGGSADGTLRVGDRIVSVNGQPAEGASTLGWMLRSIAGEGLYPVVVDRDASRDQQEQIWLRARAQPDEGFPLWRYPLLGASLAFFLAGLAMLSRWELTPARMGFVAATACSLRLGLCGLLPVTGFLQPAELTAYFLFWLPVGLAVPATLHGLLRFTEDDTPSRGWWVLSGLLYVLWCTSGFSLLLNGAIVAPVGDGVAHIRWDGIRYAAVTSAVSAGYPMLMLVSVGACVARILQLLRRHREGDVHRRLKWLLTAGVLFALPAALSENAKWMGVEYNGFTAWAAILTALCLAYALATRSVTNPVMVLRGFVALATPAKSFAAIDRALFPKQWEAEETLRGAIRKLKTIDPEQDWQPVVSEAIQSALHPSEFALHETLRGNRLIEVGEKSSGEPYTNRETQLVAELEQQVIAMLRERVRIKPLVEPGRRNLLRECPRCGTCYDNLTIRCPYDHEMPVPTVPVELVIDGKYEMERLIGRGGMGAVYSARDRRLDRRVAVKIMLSELFGHDGALKRFEREARAVARLSHPNIIQIYDFGPVGTLGAYQVMELVEGRSWRAELAMRGATSILVCRDWIEQLLDGLEAAHDAGIIHRDLKPDNLFLVDREGGTPLVKILDFGLAKIHIMDLSREEKLSVGAMTIGTVGYIPPEQITGQPVDARSDIYAVGRIIAETLTGSLPVDRPLASVPELADVLARCTAFAPADRYASIAHLRRELLPALERLASREIAEVRTCDTSF